MSRHLLQFFIAALCISSFTHAKNLIDCRAITEKTNACNPYSSELLRVQETYYLNDTKQLIISETLSPPSKETVKVIPVVDKPEKYKKVEDSLDVKVKEKKPLSIKVLVKKEIKAIKIVPIQDQNKTDEASKKPKIKEEKKVYGTYTVVSGDTLSTIASKFGLSVKKLLFFNPFNSKATLKIGKKFRIPLSQKMVDAISSATYTIEPGDTLSSIAAKFNIKPKALAKFNAITLDTRIRIGKKLLLPLPFVMKNFGKRRLRVTATAYNSHKNQTDSTPFLAAWNNRLRPGMKIIAVSRDMLTKYGMRNGTKVRIGGLKGYYTVRDKMNKRYKKRIDIYMGLDKRRALLWGKRSVNIYW